MGIFVKIKLFDTNMFLYLNAFMFYTCIFVKMESIKSYAISDLRHNNSINFCVKIKMGDKSVRRISSCILRKRRRILYISWHYFSSTLYADKTWNQKSYDYWPWCSSRKWSLKRSFWKIRHFYSRCLQSSYIP
jgi:hypothetical protein